MLIMLFGCSHQNPDEQELQQEPKPTVTELVDPTEIDTSKTEVDGQTLPHARVRKQAKVEKEKVAESAFTRNDAVSAWNDLPLIAPPFSLTVAQDSIELPNNRKHIIISKLPALNYTSPDVVLVIDFENDIFGGTDYYFTNGAQLSLYHPRLEGFKVSNYMPNAGHHAVNHHGLSIRQNMFTPRNPEMKQVDSTDRPFSGTFVIEYDKLSINTFSGLRLTSILQLGMIGKASMASSLQKTLHHLYPAGWDNQIANDVLVNAGLLAEKAIARNKHFEWIGLARLDLGSYQSSFGTGMQLRTGLLPATFSPFPTSQTGIFESAQHQRVFHIWLFSDAMGQYHLYNATLQGGLLNRKSPYIIDNDRINRFTLQWSAGLGMDYGRTGLLLKFVYLSPEFDTGIDHRWGSIQLIFNL